MLKFLKVVAAVIITSASFNVFANQDRCLRELSSLDRMISDYGAVAQRCRELGPGTTIYAQAQSLAREIEDIYPSMLRSCFRECSDNPSVQRTACTHRLQAACR